MGSGTPALGNLIRFGDDLELDLLAYELRRSGQSLKLERIPLEILRLLLERKGQLVTREQIVERIWGKEVYVDTDNSINAAIRKVRQVLEDDPERPRFVQTVTGMGYRFIAPVQAENASPKVIAESEPSRPAAELVLREDVPARGRPGAQLWRIMLGVALVLIALGAIYWQRVRPRFRSHVAQGRTMLAVLPFENLTGDANQEYLSDGLTEEMISRLGSLDPQRVGVIARTSVMRYKSNPEALEQIGRELGVQYVLEGSVRRDASKVRITAQLIEMKNQTHLWVRQYDRAPSDLLALQGEIALEISDEIQAAIGDRKRIQPAVRTPVSPQNYEAFDLYLKGQYFWNKRTVEGFERAIEYFQEAIARDPNYARAYASLANSYALIGSYSAAPADQFMPKARAAALQALKLDDNLAEAHLAFALVVQNYDYDWQTSDKEFRRAIELNPNYATAHQWYAEHLSWLGRFEEALAESQRARELDPFSLIIACDNGAILYNSRQYDAAIAQFRAVRELDPNFSRADLIVVAYEQKGMFKEALADIARTHPSPDDEPWAIPELAGIYGRMGQTQQAHLWLSKLEALNRRRPLDPGAFFRPSIGMGDKEQAFVWLERAYAQRANMLVTLKVDPLYDPLRADPRFQDLLRRVGLAQ